MSNLATRYNNCFNFRTPHLANHSRWSKSKQVHWYRMVMYPTCCDRISQQWYMHLESDVAWRSAPSGTCTLSMTVSVAYSYHALCKKCAHTHRDTETQRHTPPHAHTLTARATMVDTRASFLAERFKPMNLFQTRSIYTTMGKHKKAKRS